MGVELKIREAFATVVFLIDKINSKFDPVNNNAQKTVMNVFCLNTNK